MRISVMWLIAASTLLLAACAPLSEHELYQREDRMVLVKEEYAKRAEHCERSGGSMSMQARTIGQPDYFDYKSAQCVSY